MKLSERLQLLKAGYSRSDIDEMIKAEETFEGTSPDTETANVETSNDSTEDPETEVETQGHNEEPSSSVSELEATISELKATIKEMQKLNLANSRQPEGQAEKSPVDNASDILFDMLNTMEV